MLSLFPPLEFERLVKKTGNEYAAKGFSSWGHFVAMLLCQLGQAHSLREIRNGLASCFGKLRHLGIASAPKRSTLAYANEHRSWELLEKVFYGLLSRCQGEFIGKSKFRFKNRLLSFDATVIELCASLFDWPKFRRAKGAVKLHLLPDHEGYLPQYVHLSEEKVHEVNILKKLHFGAMKISSIYKDRWQIEIFFKVLKQNLRIKTFVGTSANALKIQIWTALIAILILKYLKVRSRDKWSLSNLVALLRLNLFTYRDLWEWIDQPTEPPPLFEEVEQLALRFV